MRGAVMYGPGEVRVEERGVPWANGMRSRSACAPSEPIATRLTQALW